MRPENRHKEGEKIVNAYRISWRFIGVLYTLIMYSVTYKKTARKALWQQPKARRQRVVDIVNSIAADPFTRHPRIKRLKSARHLFRYQLGDWRILYRIDRKSRTLTVLDIRPRGGAYT